MILAEELQLPYVLSCIDTRDEWFYAIHPERMVPSLKDLDPETHETITVFEGTACLQYLADRFDTTGDWSGRTAFEKGNILSWTAYQTAGLGYIAPAIAIFWSYSSWQGIHRATAKYWLYFLRGYPTRKEPIQLPRTIEK